MDKKFHPAIEAMRAADVEKLRALVAADPSLATSRSTRMVGVGRSFVLG